jgi:hypothetical protein
MKAFSPNGDGVRRSPVEIVAHMASYVTRTPAADRSGLRAGWFGRWTDGVVAMRGFVQAAAAQARAANPRVSVLAGLSTNPPGEVVSGQQLAAAIRVSSAAVSGYWLNVPGQGPRGPACRAPRPDLARQMLGQFAS